MPYSTIIRQFLLEEFLPDVPESNVTEDLDLIENGVIDSLGLLKVIAWLEDHLQASIDIDDMTPENFCSIRAINAYLVRAQPSLALEAAG
jgi:acyl carrier protein